MKTVRRAVIDVGTNSIKLLVADVEGHQVQPVEEASKQTRLGRGFYQTHRLQPAAIEQTSRAVAEFVAAASAREASSIRIVATSAARDAVNARELLDAIHQATGLKVQILSGDQEADLVFQGVTTDPALAVEPLLLLDVGGGSTEFILGQGEHKHFRQSFPLGSDPPEPEELGACRRWVKQFLRNDVQPNLQPAIAREITERGALRDDKARAAQNCPAKRDALRLVGTGGTATILARMEGEIKDYDRARIEATRLSRERLQWHVERLWGLPLEQRKQITGLPASRADVILTGAVIYESVMELFKFSELRISTRGLRFAAVMEGAGKL